MPQYLKKFPTQICRLLKLGKSVWVIFPNFLALSEYIDFTDSFNLESLRTFRSLLLNKQTLRRELFLEPQYILPILVWSLKRMGV